MIANNEDSYYSIGLLYCEGRNDQIKDYSVNAILFAKEFGVECLAKDPQDIEGFIEAFYDSYRETYLMFCQIVGSEL